MKTKSQLPKNVFVQDGRLFFRRQYKGVKYNAPFELIDSQANRKQAGLIALQIDTAMKLESFDASNFPLLKKHHRQKIKGDIPTFEDYADGWLDRKKVLATSTWQGYKSNVSRHLVPCFGQMIVSEISKLDIENWLVNFSKSKTPKTANECLRRLKSILKDAGDDYGFDVRVDRIKKIKNYDVQEPDQIKIYSLEEASNLYRQMGLRMRTMMIVSMFGGLRPGEVIALKGENIDLKNNKILVRANMSAGERKTVKTGAGIRDIDMHPILAEHLKEHLASHIHDYVFVSQRGKPFSNRQNFYAEYKRATKKAGVKHLGWNSFRRLFASMRYACSDAVPAQVAADMGHVKSSLSLDTYAKAMPHLGCKFFEIRFPIDLEEKQLKKSAASQNAQNVVMPLTGSFSNQKGGLVLEEDDGTGPRLIVK